MAHHPSRTRAARPLVLIVDGNDDTRELYATGLASLGFETIDDDGAHAFERARSTHPDIIVTEVALPALSGWNLIDDLKRDPRTRDISVIVLTGRSGWSARERAEREGCAALLVKPCLPEQLAHTLRQQLVR